MCSGVLTGEFVWKNLVKPSKSFFSQYDILIKAYYLLKKKKLIITARIIIP